MAKSKTYELAIKIAGKADSSLKAACKQADESLSSLGESAKKAGEIAKKSFVAAGTAAATIAAASVTAYTQHEKAANSLAASTGAVGQEMENLQAAMETVYLDNFGESIEGVSDAVSIVNRNLGSMPTDKIVAATEAAIALSDAFDYSVEETTRAASAIEKNFGGSAVDAFSLIAAGAQNGLDYSGELIDTINEYSSQFAKLGFTADGMFNLLQSGADSTAWNLDKVGDAIKEFSIRSIDGSDATKDAFKALGYNSKAMMATFATGGEAANQAFFDVLNRLMAMDDAVQRDALGVALFGTMWEDLGTEAMTAMANATNAAYDTQGALEQINAIQYNDLQTGLEGVKRQAEAILVTIGEQMAPYAREGLEYLSSTVLPAVGSEIGAIVPKLIDGAKWIWENKKAILAVGGAIAGAVAVYKTAQTALAAYNAVVSLHKIAVTVLATKNYPALIAAKLKDKAETLYIYGLYVKDAVIKAKSTAATVAHTVAVKASAVASKAAAVATNALGVAVKFLTSPVGIATMAIAALIAAGVWLYKNWDTVKAKAAELGAKISAVWSNIDGAVQAAIAAITGRVPILGSELSGIWSSLQDAWANIQGIFSNIIGFIDNVFSGNWSAAWQNIVSIFGNVFGLIVNLAKAPINGVISAINWVLSKINSISVTIPNWVPEIGGTTLGFNIPEIPMLASGGIATAVTLAMVGEGGEPEAILPLSKLAALLDEWTKPKPGGGSAGGGDNQYVYAPVMNFYGSTSKSDVEEANRIGFEEFKRMHRRMEAEERRKNFAPT